jgi:hypothetical protein
MATTYQIETEDGSVYEIETDDTPSAAAPQQSMMDRFAQSAQNLVNKVPQGVKTALSAGAAGLEAVGGNPIPLAQQVMQHRSQLAQEAPAVGGVAGGLVGGVPGAFLGGAAGAGLKQINNLVDNNAIQPSSGAAALNMAKEGAGQALAQGIGQFAIGPAINAVGKGLNTLGKGAAKVMSKASGVPEESFAYLTNNPSKVLPESMGGAPSKETAQAVFKQGLTDSGVPLTKTVDEIKKASSGTYKTLKAIEEAGAKGEMPSATPQELLRARQWLDDAIETTKRSGAYDTMSAWLQQKQMVQSLLDNSAPELQKASKVYAQYKRVAPFSNALPIDKAGNPSLAKLALAEFLTSGGGPRAMAKAVYASPMLQGGATAAVGAAKQVVRPLARPDVLRAFLAKYAQDRLGR